MTTQLAEVDGQPGGEATLGLMDGFGTPVDQLLSVDPSCLTHWLFPFRQ